MLIIQVLSVFYLLPDSRPNKNNPGLLQPQVEIHLHSSGIYSLFCSYKREYLNHSNAPIKNYKPETAGRSINSYISFRL